MRGSWAVESFLLNSTQCHFSKKAARSSTRGTGHYRNVGQLGRDMPTKQDRGRLCSPRVPVRGGEGGEGQGQTDMHGHGGYRRRRGHSGPSSSRARAILRACPCMSSARVGRLDGRQRVGGHWTVSLGGHGHGYTLFENISQPWRFCGAVCKVYVSLLNFLSSPVVVPQFSSVPHSGTARNCTRTGLHIRIHGLT